MVELLPWNGAVFLIDATNKENFFPVMYRRILKTWEMEIIQYHFREKKIYSQLFTITLWQGVPKNTK